MTKSIGRFTVSPLDYHQINKPYKVLVPTDVKLIRKSLIDDRVNGKNVYATTEIIKLKYPLIV